MIRLGEETPFSKEELIDRQEDNRSKQRDKHGRNGDGIIDCSNAQQRADEVTGQESANDTYDDIEQQTLLRIRSHDPAGDVPNDGSCD
jgi:hypothetical protein